LEPRDPAIAAVPRGTRQPRAWSPSSDGRRDARRRADHTVRASPGRSRPGTLMRFTRFVRLLRAQRSRVDPLQDDVPAGGSEIAWRRAMKQRVLVVLTLIGAWVVV